MKRIAILASGTGTLLEYMIDHKLPIDLVIVDRPCAAIDIACRAGIVVRMVKRDFGPSFDRDAHSLKVADTLNEYGIDIAAMMGYMTWFTPPFFDTFHGMSLNTHPSLLPAFKGENAVGDALAYGVKVTGCTIHIATEELDAGPILAQAVVWIKEHEEKPVLHERIKAVERPLYFNLLMEMISRHESPC